MIQNLHLSEEVAQALQEKQPVIALESTVITHGLPYPINVETALAMEHAVREGGAIPATIAIIKGSITIGISPKQIDYLAHVPSEQVRKCSRRDIAIAVAQQEDASTTVAGTMIIAHMAGIQVFATGGIGGVHRGHPFDVSADLMELGRTSVAVVCSGAKSILDLPLTLEVLETQGVPIIGMQTNTLPAFYTSSSGLPIDICVDSPEQVAKIISTSRKFELQQGILITIPVPKDKALPQDIAEQAIQQATDEANRQGIQGKDVTPFVLSRVAELTGKQSMDANIALLLNNARVAAEIAVRLKKLS